MTDAEFLRSVRRFNPHDDLLFGEIIAGEVGVLAKFRAREGAAASKQSRLVGAVEEIDEQILAARRSRDKEEVARLRQIARSLQSKPIRPASYLFDAWRTSLIGAGIAYTRGMHRLPRWSRDIQVRDNGLTFRAMVLALQSHIEPERPTAIDRIAGDVLRDEAGVFVEILARVVTPEMFIGR